MAHSPNRKKNGAPPSKTKVALDGKRKPKNQTTPPSASDKRAPPRKTRVEQGGVREADSPPSPTQCHLQVGIEWPGAFSVSCKVSSRLPLKLGLIPAVAILASLWGSAASDVRDWAQRQFIERMVGEATRGK